MNRKGYGRSIRRNKYKYSPKDLVRFENKIYKVLGVFNLGKYIRIKDKKDVIINTKIENVKIYKYCRGMYYE